MFKPTPHTDTYIISVGMRKDSKRERERENRGAREEGGAGGE